ncbi:MAG: sulfite oxidase heme-binding subunit YedZ [Geminicoccaceae bacterium]
MGGIKRFLNSPYTFWALLALPSIGMLSSFVGGSASPHRLLHPTGEFAARFMILAMMITPLRMLFANHRWPLWLQRRRRYIGVAAFCYALLHTYFYVLDLGSLSAVMSDALKLSIWTGWIAFLVFVPLALTSNDWAVRKLKRAWKPLQRWVYVAAVFTLGHWIFLEYELGAALVHFLPLLALEAYRIMRNNQPTKTLAEA